MKILQVINRMARSGGAEKFALDLSLALNRADGIEVEVLSIAHPDNDDFIDILSDAGIKHHVLSDSLYSLKNIPKLRRFIKQGKYDAVHVHLFPSLYFASAATMFGTKPGKLIYTEHSTSNRRRGNPLMRMADRIMYKRYDNLVGISGQVKTNLSKHLGTDRIEIINNGVDLRHIEMIPAGTLRNETGIPAEATIVTMVSRMAPGKDFSTLISAIEALPADFHVVFVGDGPLMPELKNRVANSTAKDRIHILGLRDDVISILKASDIVVLSTHHEGFSIVMLEAMGCRKPFVASAVEGIKDLVGEVAILFEYQNAAQLADGLRKLRDDKDFYEKVAGRCLGFAQAYDIDSIARKYRSLYKHSPNKD